MRTSHLILIPALAAGLAIGLLIMSLPNEDSSTSQGSGLSPSPSSEAQGSREAVVGLGYVELSNRRTQIEQPTTDEAAPSEVTSAPLPEPGADEAKEATEAAALAKKAQLREKQQRVRSEQQAAEFLRQATLIANELKLPTGSEQRIASIFIAEQEQVALVREQFKGLGMGGRQAYQDALTATRTARDEQLARYFGHEVAKSISSTPRTPSQRFKR